MPTETRASAACRALSVGPALGRGAGAGRIHSVFRSVVNIDVEGMGFLAALTGREGSILPQAIALDESPDFRLWDLEPGMPCALTGTILRLGGERGRAVGLLAAVFLAKRAMPHIAAAGKGWAASVESLDRLQHGKGCELRISSLRGSRMQGHRDTGAAGALGERLADSLRALGAAAARFPCGAPDPAVVAGLRKTVAGVIGLGQGLTPSGDDFLCGFIAALACAAPAHDALLGAMGEAIGKGIFATNDISATQLCCAMGGFFPTPLVDLAGAIGGDDAAGAMSALERVCAYGHSSGADLATGFLYGIGLLMGRPGLRVRKPTRGRQSLIGTGREHASQVPLREPRG